MEWLINKLRQHHIDIDVQDGKLKLNIPKGLDISALEPEIRQNAKNLQSWIEGLQQKDRFKRIQPSIVKEFYLLSSAQKRQYVLHQLDQDSVTYNISKATRVTGALDLKQIEAAFQNLSDRHESLRTYFELREEGPVQRIVPTVAFELNVIEADETEASRHVRDFVQPFDLTQAPLMRAGVIKLSEEDHILMIDMHHIVTDGESMNIITNELIALYQGLALPELSLQYKDYSEWQHREEASQKIDNARSFWLDQYTELPKLLQLPTEYPRPSIRDFAGDSTFLELSKLETQQLRQLAQEEGVTMYMLLLSLFNVLLSRLSNQYDLVVGTPTAGRLHNDLSGMVGMFVNTIPLRSYPSGDKRFDAFLKEVKETTLGCFDHQIYQYEELIDALDISRDTSRNPLFDVMFDYRKIENSPAEKVEELSITPYEQDSAQTSKFDLLLSAQEYGDQISVSLSFAKDLFVPETVERFLGYFHRIVSAVILDSSIKLSEIDVLPLPERTELLEDFNATEVSYPLDRTLNDWFEEQVKRTPERSCIFYEEESLTYDELNSKSNQFARKLTELGITANSKVPIVMSRGIDYVVAFLALNKVGACCVPLSMYWPKERLEGILTRLNQSLVLVNTVSHMESELQGSDDLLVVNYKELEPDRNNLQNQIDPESPMVIFYTSGTTGTPKGVVVPHKGVMNRFMWMNDYFGKEAAQSVLRTTKHIFDSSIWQLFWPMINGGKTIIPSEHTAFDLTYFTSLVQDHQITMTDFVPTLFNELVLEIAAGGEKSQFEKLKEVVIGGEAINPQAVNQFRAFYPDIRLTNLYGPTEASIGCVYFPIVQQDFQLIPIGKPISNMSMFILDPNGNIPPKGVPGEIHIGGIGLAIGYFENEERTREAFIQNPFRQGERMYRTGDLAKWLPDGNIEFLGRIDDQVKIRGFRIELKEIEHQLKKYSLVNDLVVVAKTINDDLKLVCYYLSNEHLESKKLRDFLSKRLPDYMIPSYYLRLDKIPMAASGKLDKKALPDPELVSVADYVPPVGAIEERLVVIWSNVLKLEPAQISVTANFFDLGGHSLRATVMTNKINKALGVSVNLRDLFAHQDIRSLAGLIEGSATTNQDPIISVDKRAYYPLSSAQRRMYFLQEFDKTSVSYNMPTFIRMEGDLSRERLKKAFRTLIERHEILRTRFGLEGEEAVQYVTKDAVVDVDYFDGSSGDVSELIGAFVRPFDLSSAPLFRIGLVQLTPSENILMFDIHHIIHDGVSNDILIREFVWLYNGEDLNIPSLQYKDYAVWQKSESQQLLLTSDKEYWLDLFSEPTHSLDLPTDYDRPVERSQEGGSHQFDLSSEQLLGLRKLSSESGTTMYMTILSLLGILLKKLSNQEDLVVGTPTSGRMHDDLDGMLGMFVNTLALRLEVPGTNSYKEYLRALKTRVLDIFDHQGYQYEELIDALDISRDTSRNPLFDVMFIYQRGDEEQALELEGLSLSPYDQSDSGTVAKFDLTFSVFDTDDHLGLSMIYATSLFKPETILRFGEYFQILVDAVLANTSIYLSEIDVMPSSERLQLLKEFNATSVAYPKDKTLIDLFEEQVVRIPDNVALSHNDQIITYKELNDEANQLANHLRSKGHQRTDIVGILLERSPQMMISILAVLKSGGAYLPLNVHNTPSRNEAVLKDSNANLLITGSKEIDFGGDVNIIDVNDGAIGLCRTENISIRTFPSDLAYIIYTSGSTGRPKGVMINHQSVVNLFYSQNATFNLGVDERVLQFSTIAFDASVEQIWLALLTGNTLVLIDEDIITNGQRFNQYLLDQKVTHLHATPSFLEGLEIDGANNLQRVVAGGEVCRPNLAERFSKHYDFYNEYGPTETTVTATTYSITDSPSDLNIIPIGKPLGNALAYVLGSSGELLPKGVVGELHVGGDCLAQGYLNNEALTKEKFIPNPFVEDGLIYKTGDLVKWLPDGNLGYIGRIDDQIKLRGFRIELGEIETALASHEHVGETVVLAKGEGTDRYLVAYYVADTEAAKSAFRDHLSELLPAYMIPDYFVHLSQFPLNANGKLDKKALPDPELVSEIGYVPATNLIEEQLVSIWSVVLKLEPEQISVLSNFFDLGGHSLRATVLVNKINKTLGVQVNLRDLFAHQDIRNLAVLIENGDGAAQESIVSVGKRPYYPLSSAQRRMYFLQEFDKTSVSYNLPTFIRVEGELSLVRLEKAFSTLVERHEILRTRFGLEGEEAVQYVADEVNVEITYFDDAGGDVSDVIASFVRPFDLSTGPLFRLGLMPVTHSEHVLMFDIHHIIHDGVSNELLIQEFVRLYNGEELESRVLQYKDYAVWQQSESQEKSLTSDKEYWLDLFSEPVVALDLPTDHDRPMMRNQEGGLYQFELIGEKLSALRTLSSESGTTMYMTILSLFGILLSKLSNEEDLVVGTPTSGRIHDDLEGMLGMFVNTLALRLEVPGSQSFKDYLQTLKTRVLESFDHQSYQYEELIDALEISRDTSRNPLFDVMFNYQRGDETSGLELDGLSLSPYENSDSGTVAKFDLTFSAFDTDDNLGLSLGYATSLFKPNTVESFGTYFQCLVDAITADTSITLNEIDMLPTAERSKLLEGFNNTTVAYPKDETFFSLFGAKVFEQPEHVALRHLDTVMTYRELDERSSHLAKRLQDMGVTSNDIIAIISDPCNEMIVGLLGILKSGAAFLPIDPTYPQQRIDYVLEDSHHRLLLSLPHLMQDIGYKGTYIDLSDEVNYPETEPSATKAPEPGDLCYVIYTSGSTGYPKGVMVEHHSLLNLCYWHNNRYQVSSEDHVTKYAGFGFDASVWEIFPTLIAGATLHVIDTSIRLDLEALNAYYNDHDISVSFLPTQVCEQFVHLENNSLRYLLTGGDELSHVVDTSYTVVNNYGPTEATVVTTCYELTASTDVIPIGKPIDNAAVFILDKDLNLLPGGVKGELYIGGSGVARGYLNQEELSAERFIGHPLASIGRLYRTGDIARWLDDGNLQFLGRVDDQVQLRGFRIEPAEIRHQLAKYEAIDECLVLLRDHQGDDHLIAYFTSGEALDHSALRSYLSGVLPEYMVPSYFIQVQSFTLTSNGKVDRKVLPLPEMDHQATYVEPETELEYGLVSIWSTVLKLMPEQISVVSSFFDLGGHSLRATILVNKINKSLGVQVSLRDLFAHQNIRSLSGLIESGTEAAQDPIEVVDKRAYYPMSSAQQRMYFLQEFDKTSVTYNIPTFIQMVGELSQERLDHAFRSLVERHEILRTRFGLEGEEAVQYVQDEIDVAITYFDGTHGRVSDVFASFVRPFELSNAPLFRVGLTQLNDRECVLMFDIHHIIHDGVSNEILIKEFVKLYNGEVLETRSLQYKDYAVWQQSEAQQLRQTADKKFWLDLFSEPIVALDLPTDFDRPVVRNQEGATYAFDLSGERLSALRSLSSESGTTMYMTILSLLGLLLSKLSNEEELVVGTPTSGRTHDDLEGMLGMFVNTLAMRLEVSGKQSYKDYLQALKLRVLGSFDHQGYQYEELIDALDISRDTSRNPLFDVMFTYQHGDQEEEMEMEGLTLSPYESSDAKKVSKFDMTFAAFESEDHLGLSLVYATSLFKPETIARFGDYFQILVDTVIADTSITLHEIDMLPTTERRKLLEDFNDTAMTYPEHQTIIDLFEEQVLLTPQSIALENGEHSISYEELNGRANQLANHLKLQGIQKSQVVGLMLDRSIDMIVGILSIMKSGGAYLPLDIEQPDARIAQLLEESQAAILITEGYKVSSFEESITVLDIDDQSYTTLSAFNLDVQSSPDDLAYIIYTSGSTGKPKGVMIGHDSVVNLITSQKRTIQLDSQDRVLQFASTIFDGAIKQIFLTLLSGSVLVLIKKEIILDQTRFLKYLKDHRITNLFVTPSFLKNITGSFHKELKRIVVGGEEFPVSLVNKYAGEYTLHNAYGPTETTVTSIEFPINRTFFNEARVPIGKPAGNTQVYILDKHLKLQATGVKGELYIGGLGLAKGYLNQEELTSERFIDHPIASEGKLYRTGDIARWLDDGNIEYLGRIDDQVKLRGYRIELGEIRHHLLNYDGIEECLVLSRKYQGDDFLIAYYTSTDAPDRSEIRSHLSLVLPEYMIPTYFVKVASFELTPNGKINRNVLPFPELDDHAEYVAPQSALEHELVTIWSNVLKIAPEQISVKGNFFDLGGHSLRATVLMNKINKALSVQVSLRDFFAHQDIRSLSGLIESSVTTDQDSILSVDKQAYYPLSSAQRRMYFLQEFDKTSVTYNMPTFIRMEGDLSLERLEKSFGMLVERHEILRTHFGLEGEEAVQYVAEELDVTIAYFDSNGDDIADVIHSFVRPFDLSAGPMFRVGLVKLTNKENILMFDIHHIIHDGVSNGIFIQEFVKLYNGEKLNTPLLQYKDYAVWQRSESQQLRIASDKSYWLDLFSEPIVALDLPIDYDRPVVRDQKGGTHWFEFSGDRLKGLRALSGKSGTTMYMTLLSFLGILLNKLSNEEDVVIGTPTSGRLHDDLEGMLGMFVNTLALRLEVVGGQSYKDYLQALKIRTLGSFDHQGYQYEELIDALDNSRDTSRNPLFDVMFIYQRGDEEEGQELEGLSLSPYGDSNSEALAKFDLTFSVLDTDDQLSLSFGYATSLFKPETIARFEDYFQTLVDVVLANTSITLREINILPIKERSKLLEEFNDTTVDYGSSQTIVSLFEAQVTKTPDHVALRHEDGTVTYREFDEASNQIAHYLRKKAGISNGDLIGIFLPREADLIVWIYGILKAGAAYIPIDTKLPAARVQSIVEESGLKLLLTQSAHEQTLLEIPVNVIVHEAIAGLLTLEETSGLSHSIQPTDLAYVIYTSGSTGKPKGVAIEHHSVCNILQHMQATYPLIDQDAYLFKTSYGFDVSVSELFGWFFDGGCLVVPPAGIEIDGEAVLSEINRYQITHINFSPSAFMAFLESVSEVDLGQLSGSLKYIFLAGEELPVELIRRFKALNLPIQLENIYGPTEATIYSSSYSTKNLKDQVRVPIGQPMSNIQLYVLDEYLKLVPIGVRGELYIGGSGLSRGYLNQDKLTASKFIDHPFAADGKLYRTGDVARWLDDGSVEYIGRIDDQVKLRGFRIELGEIRHHLLCNEAIEDCVVLSRKYQGDEYLMAYYTSSVSVGHTELRSYLSRVLPEYMVPTYFIEVGSFSLTSNGKINRKVLPLPEMEPLATYVAPRTELEYKLVAIWSMVLKLAPEQISVVSSFFDLGGHSLRATVLVNKINKALGVQVNLRDLFAHQDIRSLNGLIEGASGVTQDPIISVGKRTYYPLSAAQRRMYFLQEFDKISVSYNMPTFLRMEGELAPDRLIHAFKTLVERHEILRTCFGLEGEEAVQYVADEVNVEIDYFDRASGEVSDVIASFVRPFDLSTGPLFRVGLTQVTDKEYILMFDIHHIIHDGVSNQIFIQEFVKLYNGEQLDARLLQYKDYAVWQHSESQQLRQIADKEYWLDLFSEPVIALDLPTDYDRPMVRNQEGGLHMFELSGDRLKGLRALSGESGTTMYMILLSLFGILLSKLGNEEDLVVGTPTSGRVHDDLDGMLGMFVNTLALRLEMIGNQSFKDYLQALKNRVLGSFDHQGYQYEELIDALDISRDTSRNPLFDVMFNYQRDDEAEGLELEGLSLSPYFDVELGKVAKFDLTFSVMDTNDHLGLSFRYATSLFKHETIVRFEGYFQILVDVVLSDMSIALKDIDMLPVAERIELLEDFNDTKVDYPTDETFLSLFRTQVAERPDHVALRHQDEIVTYRVLDERSTRLASRLQDEGVVSNEIIAILSDPCHEMIVGLLGILKAGAAFLPIDPTYPQQRIDYVLKDSQHRLLLSLPHLIQDIDYQGTYIDLSDEANYLEREPSITKAPEPADLCYVIYTSGSTGYPKGVMIEHHNLANLCFWHNNRYEVSAEDHVTKYAGFGFDASVWEIFPTLVAGATLHVIDASIRLDLAALIAYYNEHDISISFLPTQVCEQFVQLENHSLRYLLTGGDELTHVTDTSYAVVNNYGPTEATVVTTCYELTAPTAMIPIGMPIDNTEVYILDKDLNLLPRGVKGELYIGGSGIARGYLNQEGLTAERFIKHPLSSSGRLYRTGDVARWLNDGNLQFLGRVDDQVQLRGFRIELGEIRHHLSSYDAIDECLVLLCEHQGDDHLIAYFTSAKLLDHSAIRSYLLSVLPEYMVPTYYVQVEFFELTANGKINRKVLPLPEMDTQATYVAPQTELEHELVAIWSTVLKLEKEQVSVNANFFDLGGHSLRATIMVNKINELLQKEVPLQYIFQYSTISLLAQKLAVSGVVVPNRVDDMVLLNERTDEKDHIFFFHDGSGDVQGYMALVSQLEDYTCWGMRSTSLEHLGPVNLDLKNVAAEYIASMLQVQPEGPFHIAGWSLGGVIAFELVKQLEAIGEEVNTLWMIDTVFHHDLYTSTQISDLDFTIAGEKSVLKTQLPAGAKMIDGFSGTTEEIWRSSLPLFEQADKDVVKESTPAAYGPLIPHFEEIDAHTLISYVNTIRSLERAEAIYQPQIGSKLNAQLVYIGASDTNYEMDWLSEYFEREVLKHVLVGDHFSIMSQPAVNEVASIINQNTINTSATYQTLVAKAK